MDSQNDLVRHASGIGGVIVSLLLSLKEGWRVLITKAAAGLVMVYLLRGFAEVTLARINIPPDAAGFLLGGFGVQVFTKLADTLQQLEFAKPFNTFIERWTGAKAPKEGA